MSRYKPRLLNLLFPLCVVINKNRSYKRGLLSKDLGPDALIEVDDRWTSKVGITIFNLNFPSLSSSSLFLRRSVRSPSAFPVPTEARVEPGHCGPGCLEVKNRTDTLLLRTSTRSPDRASLWLGEFTVLFPKSLKTSDPSNNATWRNSYSLP